MATETRCPRCKSAFRVPDDAVGKPTRCKKCKQPFTVAAKVVTKPDQWQAKSPTGEEYGPVMKAELDAWVAEGRLTSEWQLLPQGATQWKWSYDVYSQLLPPAETVSVAPTPTTSTVPSTKRRPAFRARKYPAMRFVSYLLYGLAVLTAASLVFSLIGIAMVAGGGMMLGGGMDGELNDAGNAMAGSSAVFGVVMLLASLLYHGMFIALFVYAAESVRIVLDIQSNTQETAHYAKHGLA